jgi:hypothetical protein
MPSPGISLEEVLAHNNGLRKGPKGLVGVFGRFVFRTFEVGMNVLKNFKSEERVE